MEPGDDSLRDQRFWDSFGEHPGDYDFDWPTINRDAGWDAASIHVLTDPDGTES